MESEQQLGVNVIGYSAYLVTPAEDGLNRILAVFDFMTGYLHVAGTREDAHLLVRPRGQLKPFLRQLQSALPDLQSAIGSPTGEHAEVRGLEVRVDLAKGETTISAGENRLIILGNREVGPIVEGLIERTAKWNKILNDIEEVGRNSNRALYENVV